MMLSLRPHHALGGPSVGASAPHTPLSQPLPRFGNDSNDTPPPPPTRGPLELPEDSCLLQSLFGGVPLESFAEQARKNPTYKFTAYPKSILKSMEGAGLLEQVIGGWAALLNPTGYTDLIVNKNYALDNQISQEGIEQAYFHGEIYPTFNLKAGQVIEAVANFKKAIEADPVPADSYFALGEFLDELIDYRQYLLTQQEKTGTLPQPGNHPLEVRLSAHRFSHHPFMKIHERQENGFFATGFEGRYIPLPQYIMAANTVDYDKLRQELLEVETLMGWPLEKLAQEAYSQAAQFTEIQENMGSGQQRRRAISLSLSQKYAGNLDGAIRTLTDFLDKRRGIDDPGLLDIRLAKLHLQKGPDGLQTGPEGVDKALALYEKVLLALTSVGSQYHSFESQWQLLSEYLDLWRTQADGGPDATALAHWEAALPTLKKVAAEITDIAKAMADGNEETAAIDDFAPHLFLGDAHRALGQSDKAKKAYQEVLRGLEAKIDDAQWITNGRIDGRTEDPDLGEFLDSLIQLQIQTNLRLESLNLEDS